SNLLGVPLNGTWSLRITDNLLIDNGYIFSWFIKFGANIESTTGYTSPTITSESWATHPDITVLSTGGVTITPSQTGFNCYDYTTIDSSGCTFTDQYCIEVRDPQTDFPTVDLYIYDSDANGTEDFNLDFNTDRLIGNMDAATTTVTYYNTLADAQNQSNPIFNTDSFANTTNPQTIYASVNNSNLLCQNVIVDFDLILTNQPVTDSDNDTIPDLSEDLNGNGDLTDDDTDGDGIPNYLDDDDDGDGVPTAVETSGVGARGTNFTFIDTDGDGIENYLDNDDDGDGVFTEDEDYNGNGDPTDDDTDGSGIPDFLESTVTLSIDSITRDAFVIYPNPFYENNFEIRYSNSNNNTLKATLYNMNGASVLTKSYPINESGIIKVETPNLTSGIYFLQLNTNQNSVYKLIKK
ncbi:MAG: T9SS type A sorting domain-containing protein, partial [Nonlabens sp.]